MSGGLRARRARSGGVARRAVDAAAAALGMLCGALCGIALTIVTTEPARADEVRATLWAERAPLAGVLETLYGARGLAVRVDPNITDLVEGRLVGDVDEIAALLAATHDLSVHEDGDTVWVDRADERIVDFVALEGERLEEALAALQQLPPSGGEVVAEGSGRGLILTGSRAYVLASLARLALVAPELGAGSPPPLGAASGYADAAADSDGWRIVLVSATDGGGELLLSDGQRVGPGEDLPDGARVLEITSDEVVLEDADGGRRVLALR